MRNFELSQQIWKLTKDSPRYCLVDHLRVTLGKVFQNFILCICRLALETTKNDYKLMAYSEKILIVLQNIFNKNLYMYNAKIFFCCKRFIKSIHENYNALFLRLQFFVIISGFGKSLSCAVLAVFLRVL